MYTYVCIPLSESDYYPGILFIKKNLQYFVIKRINSPYSCLLTPLTYLGQNPSLPTPDVCMSCCPDCIWWKHRDHALE